MDFDKSTFKYFELHYLIPYMHAKHKITRDSLLHI